MRTVFAPDHTHSGSSPAGDPGPAPTAQELAVLAVLVESIGRVVSRHELARRSGLGDRSERRCDAILVQLSRHLGPNAITTVRSRGWLLTHEAADRARALLTP